MSWCGRDTEREGGLPRHQRQGPSVDQTLAGPEFPEPGPRISLRCRYEPRTVPQKGIDIALPVALARGFVIFCRHYYGYVCDLIIAEIGRTTIVRVCRTSVSTIRLREWPGSSGPG